MQFHYIFDISILIFIDIDAKMGYYYHRVGRKCPPVMKNNNKYDIKEKLIMIAIINAKIVTVTNGTIEKGALLVEDGKIKAYGADIQIPEGAEIIDAKGGWLTPGLIDVHTHISTFNEPNTMPGLQNDGNEGSSPITPEIRGLDALNPHDPAIENVRKAGFTTCYTGPGSANLIGGSGLTFKLRGNDPEEMEIPGHRHMKFALGENPKRFYGSKGKAPWTRMASGAMIRKQLILAQHYSDALLAYEKGEGEKPKYDFQLEALVPVVRGEMKARIHAHRADDILTAIRIGTEFNLDYSIEHCTEGYKIIKELQAVKADVILGPLMTGTAKMEIWGGKKENPGILNAAGDINVMLTADSQSATAMLPVHIGICMAHGLKEQDAFEGVTIRSAKFLGIDDKVGSIEVGKDADIAIFDGHPFCNFTRCKLTMIDGVVYHNTL